MDPAIKTHELTQPTQRFMRPVEVSLQIDQTIGQALLALRGRQIEHRILYFYVTDADGRLQGVIRSRDLLLKQIDVPVRDIMQQPVISVPASAPLELAMELFAMYRLLALPVVDEQNRLVGMVDIRLYSDEIYELAERNRAMDLFRVIGVSVQQLREGSAFRGFRLRMPWLSCNLIGGVACAVIAAIFDQVLAEVLLLAMFIPLVLTLAESISIQAVTLGLAHLHAPQTSKRLAGRLMKEWKTAALLGGFSGVAVGVAAILWGQGIHPPLVITASVAGSMLLAATLGTIIPFLLNALKLDPKVAAGPVVLMFTDIATLALFLGLGTWWLL